MIDCDFTEKHGLWSEQAQVHHLSCLILPDHVDCKDYSGSLANMITGYAFLRQIVDEGHRGVIATAGNSTSGRMLLELARREGIPALAIVRSAAPQEELRQLGAAHVLVASDPAFESEFAALAEKLKATAIFDGIGGAFMTRILPLLPMNSAFYGYGFMAGPEPVSFPTALLVTKNLVMRGFSNFASATVQNPQRLSAALTVLGGMVDHPAFKTRTGETFSLDQIGAAMKAETETKSILVP